MFVSMAHIGLRSVFTFHACSCCVILRFMSTMNFCLCRSKATLFQPYQQAFITLFQLYIRAIDTFFNHQVLFLREHLVEACALDAAKQIKTFLGDSYLIVKMDEERSDLALLG